MSFATRARRRLALLATTATTAAAVLGLAATPASAGIGQPTPAGPLVIAPTSGSTGRIWSGTGTATSAVTLGPHQQAFAGHFSGDTGGDLFLYNPGSGSDAIVHLTKGGAFSSLTPTPVSGTYTPVVGDFDGNGIDDILWYAPGSGRDSLWLFGDAGTHTTIAETINGTYRPTVLDANGDGRDDILWYGPGSAGDSLWLFGSGATSHTTKSLLIGGDYTVVAGRFGVTTSGAAPERVVFYNPSGADYFWTFDTSGNHTSALLPSLDGNYQLFSGQWIEETYGSIFFYGPGALHEVVWAFGPGAGGDVAVEEPAQVSGTYTVTAGDFDGNGLSDLAFAHGSSTTVWELQYEGGHTETTLTGLPDPALGRLVPLQG